MNRLIINIEALKHNLDAVGRQMEQHGASWTVVTKVLCGHSDTIKALQKLGIRSIGDSRLDNLRDIERIVPDFETWYLRIPDVSSIPEVVKYSDVSLNSEIAIIKLLNEEARRQDKIHRIIMMVELGDLREGILPGSLVRFYEEVFHLSNIEVLGIGANLGCLAGVIPTVDQFMQLVLYRELLELKFKHKLPLLSAGSTVVLPLIEEKQLPKAINHFRIGEAVFLGSNLIHGGTLPDLSNEVFLLEAEIAEIKEKGLVPMGETGTSTAPFETDVEDESTPGQRGYRALVSIGHLDTDIGGLTPINPKHRTAGASSDITVINIGDDSGGLKVGDSIKFRVNYSALLRLMNDKYITKEVVPPIEGMVKMQDDRFSEILPEISQVEMND